MFTKDSLLKPHREKVIGLESNLFGQIELRGPTERRSGLQPKKSKALQQVEEGSRIVSTSNTASIPPTARSIFFTAAPWTEPINKATKTNTRPFSIWESRSVWVTMRTCVCGPIRKDPYRDYKQRSMLFCRRPCSRRVCECVCILGVGQAGITQLSSRGGHIYALNSLVDQKAFFSLGVFSSPTRPHICRCAPAYTDSLTVWMCIQTDTNEHKIMFLYILWISMLLLLLEILTKTSAC